MGGFPPLITARAEDERGGRAGEKVGAKQGGSGKGEVKEMNTVCGEVRHVTTR